jgi:hypothetical protein
MTNGRWMRWAGHLARMGEKRNSVWILKEKPKERHHYEVIDVTEGKY